MSTHSPGTSSKRRPSFASYLGRCVCWPRLAASWFWLRPSRSHGIESNGRGGNRPLSSVLAVVRASHGFTTTGMGPPISTSPSSLTGAPHASRTKDRLTSSVLTAIAGASALYWRRSTGSTILCAQLRHSLLDAEICAWSCWLWCMVRIRRARVRFDDLADGLRCPLVETWSA